MSIALTLILAFVAGVYLRGSRGAHPWRTASFLGGLVCIWVASASPMAHLDGRMLTAHMIQHLLLMTFAPPLIWLGEPVRAFLPFVAHASACRIDTRVDVCRARSSSRTS